MNYRDSILMRTQRGLDVFNYYMPFKVIPKKKFKSPFYNDTKPSCHVYLDPKTGYYRYMDFGAPEYSGDCFWFVATMFNYDMKNDFRLILSKIDRELGLCISMDSSRCGKDAKAVPLRKPQPSSPEPAKVSATSRIVTKKAKVTEKDFSEEELRYWSKYGIGKETLSRFNVTSVVRYSNVNDEGKPYSFVSSGREPMFAYHVGSSIKVYRPFSKPRFLYASSSGSDYIFGMEQLPSRDSIVFITGGEKDVMSLAAHGFNAITFNSETAKVPKTILESLKRRFKHIVLLYDMDETGVKYSREVQMTNADLGLLRMELPLSGTKDNKDVSDFFAGGGTAEEINGLFMSIIKEKHEQTASLLKCCELDYDNPPELSRMVVGVNGVPIGSCGNLLCVTGGEGVGKSHYISSIIAGALSKDELDKDMTLGLDIARNRHQKAVLLFDTEQSEAQLYKNVSMILKRSGFDSKPEHFHPVYMTAMSRNERLTLIRDALDLLYYRHKGIQIVVIDGVADLVRSANDEQESISIVDDLYKLADIYNTCIVCVLHFVPNGFKLRGHLGSELQRKSSGILSIEKDEIGNFSVVKAMKVRDGSPLDVPLMKFGWDKEKDMFIYLGEKSKDEKEKWKETELKEVAKSIFKHEGAMPYARLVTLVMDNMDVKERTAKKYVSIMKERGIITQGSNSNYNIGKL